MYCNIQQKAADLSPQLDEARKRLAEAKEKFTALEREFEPLKGFEDITAQSIVNLISQQRMVEVDLAGINARIATCNKLLTDRQGMPASRIEQVETVKISAEIELVGLAARKEAIGRLVANGRRRIELADKIGKAGGEVVQRQNRLNECEVPVQAAKTARQQKLPFAQVQGKILIRRAKWVERPAMAGGMMGMPGGMPMGGPGMMGGMGGPMGGTSRGMSGMPGAGGMGGMMPGAGMSGMPAAAPQSKPTVPRAKAPAAAKKSDPSTGFDDQDR
jgi:hypothetical protein